VCDEHQPDGAASGGMDGRDASPSPLGHDLFVIILCGRLSPKSRAGRQQAGERLFEGADFALLVRHRGLVEHQLQIVQEDV
jgi:hypothetical protein